MKRYYENQDGKYSKYNHTYINGSADFSINFKPSTEYNINYVSFNKTTIEPSLSKYSTSVTPYSYNIGSNIGLPPYPEKKYDYGMTSKPLSSYYITDGYAPFSEASKPKSDDKNKYENHTVNAKSYTETNIQKPSQTSSSVILEKYNAGLESTDGKIIYLSEWDHGEPPTNLGRKVSLMSGSSINISGFVPATYSSGPNGIVEAYASNSNKGLVRYFKY